MSNYVKLTYNCCGSVYTTMTGIIPTADIVPTFDRMHTEEHPDCPPLNAPLQNAGLSQETPEDNNG